VIVKEALANGRLTGRGSPPGAVTRFADASGVSVDIAAFAAVLHQPWVDVVLSGAVTPAQLSANVAALDIRVAADAVPLMTGSPAEYWTARSQLRWK
jgi:aryl-alcohol dehydrogenase-like predicted oxidoreductase